MPKVILHTVDGEVVEKEVKDHANLVVMAGIGNFPELKYGCGMGRCTRCTCKVLDGADGLPEPNYKEKEMLNVKLDEGYRLTCQLEITEDVEITQQDIKVKPPRRRSRTLTNK